MPGSIPGSLSALGYPGPQQGGLPAGGLPPGSLQASGLPPSVANQASLSQPPSAAVYSSGMQIPSSSHFPPATYSQSPYASHTMYQSALNYQSQQQGMAGQPSASAYMAAAAEAQSSGSPYGSVRLPTTTAGYHTSSVPGGAPRGPSSLYGYPGSLNGQAMFASHPSSMQPGMQPGMHPSMHPGVYQGMPGSSIPGLAAPQPRPASGPYAVQSPFTRPLP